MGVHAISLHGTALGQISDLEIPAVVWTLDPENLDAPSRSIRDLLSLDPLEMNPLEGPLAQRDARSEYPVV